MVAPGAAVHGDADIGQRERRGVVHAVAHHHHGAGAVGARHQPGHDVALGFGRQAAERVAGRQAQLGADARDDVGVIAREDPHAHAARAQGRDGPPRIRAQRVADAGHAGHAAVDRDEHRAEAVGDDRLGGRGEVGRNDVPAASTWARFPTRTSWPSSRPAMPCPGTSTTSSTVLHDPDRPARRRVRKARATAWDDSASSARANCSAASSPCQRATVARPSVSVPVLSSSTVSTGEAAPARRGS